MRELFLLPFIYFGGALGRSLYDLNDSPSQTTGGTRDYLQSLTAEENEYVPLSAQQYGALNPEQNKYVSPMGTEDGYGLEEHEYIPPRTDEYGLDENEYLPPTADEYGLDENEYIPPTDDEYSLDENEYLPPTADEYSLEQDEYLPPITIDDRDSLKLDGNPIDLDYGPTNDVEDEVTDEDAYMSPMSEDGDNGYDGMNDGLDNKDPGAKKGPLGKIAARTIGFGHHGSTGTRRRSFLPKRVRKLGSHPAIRKNRLNFRSRALGTGSRSRGSILQARFDRRAIRRARRKRRFGRRRRFLRGFQFFSGFRSRRGFIF